MITPVKDKSQAATVPQRDLFQANLLLVHENIVCIWSVNKSSYIKNSGATYLRPSGRKTLSRKWSCCDILSASLFYSAHYLIQFEQIVLNCDQRENVFT